MRRHLWLSLKQKEWRIVPVIILAFISLMIGTSRPFPVEADWEHRNQNSIVFPPNSAPYGLTYGEWSAKWWQFVYLIPAADNPLLQDDTCNVGQSGPVWFLTGKFCNQPSCANFLVERNCTVPRGKALFFPIANSQADNLGVDPLMSVEALRAAAKSNQDGVTSMTCEVDSRPIEGLDPAITSPYRVLSPVFQYQIPDNNIFQFLGAPFGPQTVSPAVADGVFLMLKPLHLGQHTIHFTASFGSAFSFDVTYHIEVAP